DVFDYCNNSFAAGILIITPYLTKWFFKHSNNEAASEFNFVMADLYVVGVIAIFVNLEQILCGVIISLVLKPYIYDHSPLMNRIRFTANALFIPFFLLSVCMLMDLRVLVSNSDALLVTGLILITAIIGKILASWITSKVYGYSKVENRLIFGL